VGGPFVDLSFPVRLACRRLPCRRLAIKGPRHFGWRPRKGVLSRRADLFGADNNDRRKVEGRLANPTPL